MQDWLQKQSMSFTKLTKDGGRWLLNKFRQSIWQNPTSTSHVFAIKNELTQHGRASITAQLLAKQLIVEEFRVC